MSETTLTVSATLQRNWAQRVLSEVFSHTGPKLGLAWIIVISFCGIFAPFLANSFPLIAKVSGEWQFPAIRYFTWADTSLILGTIISVVTNLFIKDVLIKVRVLVTLAIFAIFTSISLLVVHPPKLQEMDQYRIMDDKKQIEWALWAPIPYSPTDRLRDKTFDPVNKPHPWKPDSVHWMGTEKNGSDITSRMIHACRIVLSLGLISTGLSLVIGIVIGSLMGYFSGIIDLIGMRIIEVFSSIPTLFLMLTAVAFFGRNLYLMMLIIGLTSWTGIARFVRAEFLKFRHVDFVQAAQALGLPLQSILFRHLLPNALAPVLVEASFGVAGAILAESTLSFLGLGLIDEASWGALLNQATGSSSGFQWWLAFYPGLAIFLTVLSYNLIGEALRDAFDPRLLKRE